MDFTITRAAPTDAGAIAALHAESWRSAYRGMLPDLFLDGPLEGDRMRLWDERMTRPRGGQAVFKALANGELVGFACVFPDDDADWGALLDNLHVAPAHRSRGIGAGLVRTVHDYVAAVSADARMYLWVLAANVSARRFYERHGAVVADRRTVEVAPGVVADELRCAWASRS